MGLASSASGASIGVMTRCLPGILLILAAVCSYADDSDKSKLIGTWSTSGDPRATWVLAAPGDVMHITYSQNDQKISEVECNTVGRECESKQSGKPVKVSMWFNGPKLVMMETRGTEVVKRRFHASDDGQTLELETIPIVPEGKTEIVRLVKSSESH
jgi:hypothetical protein